MDLTIRTTNIIAMVVCATLVPVLALAATPAAALIHAAAVLEGPNNRVLELDGVAMTRDGTGGVVFRKQVEGVPHVFVVPFDDGSWGHAIEVDREDRYGASEPAIAAGEGGRLMVVWIQLRNVSSGGAGEYELTSASLQPGTRVFGPPTIVDPSVGEPSNGDIRDVSPSLAMAPNGETYVVYRVRSNDCSVNDPRTSVCGFGVGVEVRVARFNFRSWNSLGAINRAPSLGMREPLPSNAPSIGIDLAGEGFVAWQEPDVQNVARIWARRLFGVTPGNVLEASPEELDGKPVTSDAEAPVVAMGPFGEARIAFRITGGLGSAVTTPQLYVNSISSALGRNAAQLTGPIVVPGATNTQLGAPTAAIDAEGNYRVVWPQGGTVQALTGNIEGARPPVAIGTTTGERALTTIEPAGGAATAWLTSASGSPAVEVREDFPGSGSQFGQFGGSIPGPIGDLSIGASGRGDALLGWTVGVPGYSEIVGDFVQAPPQPFIAIVPLSWVRPQDAAISWEPASDAVAGETYTVYVDGKASVSGLTGLSTHLSTSALGSGVHHVQVLAMDPAGQRTLSDLATIKVDAEPPAVKALLIDHGHGVRVRVSDAYSGVDAKATAISFGDGARSRSSANAAHEYARAGTYVIVAHVRNNVGSSATVTLRVRVA